MDTPVRLLREAEVAEVLAVSVLTLRRWRWAGRGPAYRKLGAAVRYDPDEITAYVDSCRRTSTSETADSRGAA